MPKAPHFHKPNTGPQPNRKARSDRARGTAAQRGYGSKWRREREQYLSDPDNAFCVVDGCNQLATVVDHKVPHKGDQKLFWRRSNWQPMCKRHHDRKTARDDGGFGRPYAGR